MIKLSCWHWQVGYVYTNILREICLRGINAVVQKTAFLGFCNCAEQFKNVEELKGASFLDLLHYYPSADDSKYQSCKFTCVGDTWKHTVS